MSNDLQFTRKQGITERHVDDVIFLVNPDTEALYHLDPIGAALWRLLEDATSSEEASSLLCQAFPDADHKAIRRDVDNLIEEFSDHNLIAPSKG